VRRGSRVYGREGEEEKAGEREGREA